MNMHSKIFYEMPKVGYIIKRMVITVEDLSLIVYAISRQL